VANGSVERNVETGVLDGDEETAEQQAEKKKKRGPLLD
jgi:hypothetical protein